jgi:hypothetical protein
METEANHEAESSGNKEEEPVPSVAPLEEEDNSSAKPTKTRNHLKLYCPSLSLSFEDLSPEPTVPTPPVTGFCEPESTLTMSRLGAVKEIE